MLLDEENLQPDFFFFPRTADDPKIHKGHAFFCFKGLGIIDGKMGHLCCMLLESYLISSINLTKSYNGFTC